PRLRSQVSAHLDEDLVAATDALADRRRPEIDRGRDPVQDLASLLLVTGATGMFGCLLPCCRRCRRARLVPVQPRLEPTGTAKAMMISVAFEHRQHPLHRPRRFLCPSVGDPQEL